MHARRSVLAALCVAAGLWGPSAASAAPSAPQRAAAATTSVIAGSDKVELTDDDGDLSGSLTLTNVSADSVTVSVTESKTGEPSKCGITPSATDGTELRPGIPAKVQIKIPARCELNSKGTLLAFVADGKVLLTVDAKAKAAEKPTWATLWAFPGALGASALLLLLALSKWSPRAPSLAKLDPNDPAMTPALKAKLARRLATILDQKAKRMREAANLIADTDTDAKALANALADAADLEAEAAGAVANKAEEAAAEAAPKGRVRLRLASLACPIDTRTPEEMEQTGTGDAAPTYEYNVPDEANTGSPYSFREKLATPLKGLSGDWKFKDSWASNVTILSAAFAAFASTGGVLKAIVGEEPEAVVAVALVASVIAAALVATGPLLLMTFGRSRTEVNVLGLLLGSAATLTGAGGQLTVLTWLGFTLDLHGAEFGILIGGCVALALLATYAYRSTIWNLRLGGTTVPAAPPSDTTKAADTIAAAIRGARPSAGSASRLTHRAVSHATFLQDFVGNGPGWDRDRDREWERDRDRYPEREVRRQVVETTHYITEESVPPPELATDEVELVTSETSTMLGTLQALADAPTYEQAPVQTTRSALL